MCADQQGKCAICGEIPGESLQVDHDHDKGPVPDAVRGLLCTCCNRAFGLMKESPEIFESAAAYARKHNKT
jgi:Autographiviridae endonuclease VII